MKWLTTLLLLQASWGADVTVQPLSGSPQTGALVSLDSNRVVLEVDAQAQEMELRDLLAIEVGQVAKEPAGEDLTFVKLVDGSDLISRRYRVTDRLAEMQLAGRTIGIETRNIETVRFHPPAEALDQQWREITQGEHQGDVIVLRRSDTALDMLEGIFHGVTDETVEFEYADQRMKQLYGPRRDRSFTGEGLWLSEGGDAVTRYERGLAIHSRSELVYRLTEPYRKLTAIAGIDSRVQGRGNLELVITGDDRELFRQTISGQDPPLPLNVNLEGVRRLKILVDFGESLDVADHLNLCNARIIK